ncbi:Uncharacterized protein ToN1_47520 [Aromatoleum petrolei]|nr:Uncharacterized protein ToN1_47520 [Aromatoleum petrolei]
MSQNGIPTRNLNNQIIADCINRSQICQIPGSIVRRASLPFFIMK